MGKVFTIVGSTKQNLNILSSTETKIVAVDDCIPAILRTRYWLSDQVYDVFEKIVYQYNKSDIILKNNGRALSRN